LTANRDGIDGRGGGEGTAAAIRQRQEASTVKQAKKVKDAATSLAAEVVAGATSLNDAYRQVRSKPVQNHL
jgi:hypothetical protein